MNRRSSSLSILLVAFAMLSLILLSAGIAQGQAISGNLTGTVTDSTGAAVNGATVEAVNIGTGQKINTTTRGSGEYVFTNLPVGTYRITVSSANFRTTTLEKVPVELNNTLTANVQLQVGTSATTVLVTLAASPQALAEAFALKLVHQAIAKTAPSPVRKTETKKLRRGRNPECRQMVLRMGQKPTRMHVKAMSAYTQSKVFLSVVILNFFAP